MQQNNVSLIIRKVMIRKVLLVTAAAGLLALSASAQEPQQNRCHKGKCEQKECIQKKKAFEGIELTEEQMAKLEKISRKDMKKECREEKLEARAERCREHLAQIREILTPEQYVKYLENRIVMQSCRPNPGRPDAPHHGPHHGPGDGFGPRAERP